MKKTVWYGEKATAKVKAAAMRGVSDAGEFILAEANETCPIDEGTLNRSGDVFVDSGNVTATVSYDTPYAARMHEDEGITYTDPRARRKWLELTLQENAPKIMEYLKSAVARAIG